MPAETISYLTLIRFGDGAISELGAELDRLGLHRPMIVTDAGVVAAGLLERAAAAAGPGRLTAVFADTPSNPTEAVARAAARHYRASAADGLVALGGGSAIDLAKAVALLASHPPGPLWQYAAAAGGSDRIGPVSPLIAIPTTAGSGSEVGRAALIVMADGVKRAIVSPSLLPMVAICDPELTHGLPPSLTAGTGMDAIAHCIEALLSPRFNPPADAIAADGLRRGMGSIEKAVGGDRSARAEMMMASIEGGLAFQKGLGAVHALSHALAAIPTTNLHHGTLNAVLLPAVLAFNLPAVGDAAAAIAQAAGVGDPSELPTAIRTLTGRLGLPAGLREMGVPVEALAPAAAAAPGDFSHGTNPRPAVADDYLAILRASF